MTIQEILEFDWVEQRYSGLVEIYPKHAGSHSILELVLIELRKTYSLIKITDGYIRGFKR